MDTRRGQLLLLLVIATYGSGQNAICPTPESIQPCICTNRHEDFQIWCTHSDLTQVSKGFQKIGAYVKKPIDELIIENNFLPSLPGRVFQNVKILRLMLRHNGLERLSGAWLETQERNLVEVFIVENDLRSLPAESLMKLQNLQAITIQSHNLKRIPVFSNLPKLRYISIQSANLNTINENTFDKLPNLEKLFIQGSSNLHVIKENALYNLPKLIKLEITHCGINAIHMRAFSLIPSLKELSLSHNQISDATMVGRTIRDLSMLSFLDLNSNRIEKLNEGTFVDQPMLEKIYLANNNISIIHHGAFHRVPSLKILDLNYNKIRQIHPESFLQQSASGVEELNLIGNEIMHISEFRALLDTLPRLKFVDMSDNLLQEIPRGALRGHPSLERLHLNKNSIKMIEADAFVAMPSLRELHLSNNSLSDLNEGPFWNLPALKGLDISFNYFHRLQPKLLYNLPALRRINVSYNQLTIIDPIIFMETPLMEYVNISGNSLMSIHPATFRNLANLYEIDVSSNRLIEFVPGLPRGLEQLFLHQNQITSLPAPPSPDLDLPSLRTLDLSSNGLQKIPNGSMKTLHNLRRLYIKRNGIREIEITTFSDLERLEILDLSDNQIFTIHTKSFSKLMQLKQINLHGNTVENFDLTAIQDNLELHGLDLSKNRLKSITENIITKVLELEILNISSNNLIELPTTLNMLSKLKILDASFNHIKNFDGNILNSLHTLTNIKLPNNKLFQLRAKSFNDLENVETIDLDNNQIEIIYPNAIANLPNLISVYLGRNHIIDIPDHAFINLPKLRIIELQGNRLQFISIKAFESMPLVQYMNMSNNQITNIDNSGLRQLSSLEILDLSFNKITKLTKVSFQYMEWLIELNLDNNFICYLDGQPFDVMPRLKVLSLRHNKLTTISEVTFEKLRSNIAILDLDGNPLICNCAIIWLKSWLSESTSIGPKCADGTYVKGMPFSRDDCLSTVTNGGDFSTCITHENEALLPNLATSQVFSHLDKIKDYSTQTRHSYINKINNRPSPEESDYFYDEYVDYPYNGTIIDGFTNELNLPLNNRTQYTTGKTSTIYAEIKNKTSLNPSSAKVPTSPFTFFGMPLPAIDMGKILNTGRKLDWPDKKEHRNSRYQTPQPPLFETGGFTPMLPSTASGFIPIANPSLNITPNTINVHNQTGSTKQENIQMSTLGVVSKPVNTIQRNTTHQKVKAEVHELQSYTDANNKTQIAYNRTKSFQGEKNAPNNLHKYNFMESNITIAEVTEKEVPLITTDISNDMTLQAWIDTTTVSSLYPTPESSRPIRKPLEQPTALSAVMKPKHEEILNNFVKRPATITKVNIPHAEQYDMNVYSPVINREAKTRFYEITSSSNTKTLQDDGKEWYYKNYNNSNLEPYVAPGVHMSISSYVFNNRVSLAIVSIGIVINLLIL